MRFVNFADRSRLSSHSPTIQGATRQAGAVSLSGTTVPDGWNRSALTQKMVQDWIKRAARRAKVEHDGVHVLRHTFCSHLAMRGAPARAIQELAGHQDLGTTQRYMHLSPSAIDGAIRLLDRAGPAQAGHYGRGASDLERGDILETAGGEKV